MTSNIWNNTVFTGKHKLKWFSILYKYCFFIFEYPGITVLFMGNCGYHSVSNGNDCSTQTLETLILDGTIAHTIDSFGMLDMQKFYLSWFHNQWKYSKIRIHCHHLSSRILMQWSDLEINLGRLIKENIKKNRFRDF